MEPDEFQQVSRRCLQLSRLETVPRRCASHLLPASAQRGLAGPPAPPNAGHDRRRSHSADGLQHVRSTLRSKQPRGAHLAETPHSLSARPSPSPATSSVSRLQLRLYPFGSTNLLIRQLRAVKCHQLKLVKCSEPFQGERFLAWRAVRRLTAAGAGTAPSPLLVPSPSPTHAEGEEKPHITTPARRLRAL